MKIVNISYPGEAYERVVYPAGEKLIRLKPDNFKQAQKADEVRIWATVKNGDLTEVLLLADAINRPNHTRIILPYLPYGRADRRFTPEEACGLRVTYRILNAVHYPVVTLDVHSDLCVFARTNVSPTSLIGHAIGHTRELSDNIITLLLPDAGAKQRYDLEHFGHPVLNCTKKRDPRTGKLTGFEVPEISTNSVLIVDDICDGGGTFLGIADALEKQHLSLYLYVTHGIFSQGFKKLHTQFNRIFCSDSFNIPDQKDAVVLPCRPVIEQALKS
jgi:ribose-phosphate pyrophosphokinase